MSKFRDEDEFNIDEDQRYAFGEDYDLDDRLRNRSRRFGEVF